jgi:serine protease DegQ
MARPNRRPSLYTSNVNAPAEGLKDSNPPGALAATPRTRATPQTLAATQHAGGPESTAKSPRLHVYPHQAQSMTWRWLALATVLGLVLTYQHAPWRQWVHKRMTQEQLDSAVMHTLNNNPLPSPATKAYEAVIGSVVRVVGMRDVKADKDTSEKDNGKDGSATDPKQVRPPSADKSDEKQAGKDKSQDDTDDDKHSVGTGVVIIDNGTILTNLHVVSGAKRVRVVFSDGLVSDADIVGMRPEHDLAVLRARRIPDDLKAVAMRSTSDLLPGDRVTAVGYPFGIGPSVSHGVVSGLKRDFRSPDGKSVLSNLIQFDAAANPGNSGGPLVTDDGAVVGIVTAIYNPTQGRFFVGLGFAVPIENAAQAAGMPPF